jgi:glutaminyl-peptide cyclotransferase
MVYDHGKRVPRRNRDNLMPLSIPRFRLSRFAAVTAVALIAVPAAAEVQTDLWDGKRALDIIVQLVKFTPRSMETPGHQQTIDYITAELAKTKFNDVKTQRWAEHAAGRTMAMTNIIARFQPDNPRRIIVATHYDSIIKAYRDAKHPDQPMPGANNSASGVAVLLETARVISELPEAAVSVFALSDALPDCDVRRRRFTSS